MPCKTLYYILTLAQVIICGKDRLCLWGEGVDVCVWRGVGGGGGWVGVLQETVSRFYR